MAIDYNADVLPLYASKLGGEEYTQELATQSSRGFDDPTVDLSPNDQDFTLGDGTNTAPVAVTFIGGTSLDDWKIAVDAAIAAGPLLLESSVIQQSDGQYVLVIVGKDNIIPVNIVTADLAAAPADGLSTLGMPASTVLGGGDLGIGRADQKNEQRLLTTLGVLVSHLRLLGSRAEARNLHFILSRIATGVGSGGFVYDDRSSSVSGNVRNPTFIVTDQITIELVNPGEGTVVGAAFTTVPGGVFDLDALVTAINVDIAAIPLKQKDLEAFNDGGRLKLVSEKGHNIEIQQGVGNDLAASKSGIEFGVSKSKRAEVADKVKEEALDYFDTNRRKLNM